MRSATRRVELGWPMDLCRVVTSLGARARDMPRSRPQTYFQGLVTSLGRKLTFEGTAVSHFSFSISISSFLVPPFRPTLHMLLELEEADRGWTDHVRHNHTAIIRNS